MAGPAGPPPEARGPIPPPEDYGPPQLVVLGDGFPPASSPARRLVASPHAQKLECSQERRRVFPFFFRVPDGFFLAKTHARRRQRPFSAPPRSPSSRNGFFLWCEVLVPWRFLLPFSPPPVQHSLRGRCLNGTSVRENSPLPGTFSRKATGWILSRP